MSTSASENHHLSVTSDNDAEIFLIGENLEVVSRGVATLQGSFPAGLYKIKVSRAKTSKQQLIELNHDHSLDIRVNAFTAIAPIATVLGTSSSKVEALARDAGARNAPFLLLAHQSLERESRPLLESVRIFPWLEPSQLSEAEHVLRADTETEAWEAASITMDPSCYILQIDDGARKIHQVVSVWPGWQTRVFFARRGSDETAPVEISVQLARYGSAVVYSDHFETVEVARVALEGGRTIFSTREMVQQLLRYKFENPIAGIAGLHLFLEGLGRSRRSSSTGKQTGLDADLADSAENVIDEVLSNLEGMLGNSPDIVALKSRAGRLNGPERMKVSEPPIFWASWVALREGASETGWVDIPPVLWSSVAFSAPRGPYFAWQAATASVATYVSLLLNTQQDFLRTELTPAVRDFFADRETRLDTSSNLVRIIGAAITKVSDIYRHISRQPTINPIALAERAGVPWTVASSIVNGLQQLSTKDQSLTTLEKE